MAKRGKAWAKALTPECKAEIVAACERLIAETLKPRYLPEIRPAAERNYPVDIHGRMRGDSYAFAVRFRSGYAENAGEEYDAPFARIQHWSGRFFVHWMRHTGRWWLLHSDLTLEEAVAKVAAGEHLRPPI